MITIRLGAVWIIAAIIFGVPLLLRTVYGWIDLGRCVVVIVRAVRARRRRP